MSPVTTPGPRVSGIPRHGPETESALVETLDLWRRLAAPMPESEIAWRQDGKVVQSKGRYLARFVAYIEAPTVFARLDDVVPGEWDLTLELLPAPTLADQEGEALCAFKCRLQILGVVREDVGQGRDYKSAATDAFNRAAVRFGIANELYRYDVNWVRVDGDGRYAKPLEDPGVAYARHQARKHLALSTPTAGPPPVPRAAEGTIGHRAPPAVVAPPKPQRSYPSVKCPKCGGEMWDNRTSKRSPTAPDYRCKNKGCPGVIWPPRDRASEDYGDERPTDDQIVTDADHRETEDE